MKGAGAVHLQHPVSAGRGSLLGAAFDFVARAWIALSFAAAGTAMLLVIFGVPTALVFFLVKFASAFARGH